MERFKELLEIFATRPGRRTHVVRFKPTDAFTKNAWYKSHRDYVEDLFKKDGYQVTQHHHNYKTDKELTNCGLIYCLSDSVLDPLVEVWGIEGVSIRRIIDG